MLWIDPYPTRLPSVDDLWSRRSRASARCMASPQWLTVLTPGALPIEPLPFSSFINGIFWKSLFAEIKTFVFGKTVIVGVGKPSIMSEKILSMFPACTSFYDAMDDFPAFYKGLSRISMAAREKKLVGLVDVVYVSSTELYKRWNRAGKHITKLVHNGLDARLLPDSLCKVSSNSESQSVFGYLGTIGAWFDWAWVLELACRRPDDKIKLIGPLYTALPAKLPANIELYPACSHQDALKIMASFDVGLIPFKRNDLTISVDPIKYYEYIALGVPVLSSNFGEMSLRREERGVFIVDDIGDIEANAEAALSFRFTDEFLKKFIDNNDWNSRFDCVGLV